MLALCVSHLKICFRANFSVLFPSILSLKNLFRLTTQAQCEHKYKDEHYCVIKDGHDILERLKPHLHALKNKHGTPNLFGTVPTILRHGTPNRPFARWRHFTTTDQNPLWLSFLVQIKAFVI